MAESMVKLVYCVRKRDDVSTEEFSRYWLDQHGPLVRSVRDRFPMARYVQRRTRRLIDLGRSVVFFTEEHEIFGPEP